MQIKAFGLETSDLKAHLGRVLVGCVKDINPGGDGDGELRTYRADDNSYRLEDVTDDSKLVEAIKADLESADVIVGHNSKMFDRKFLNARLAKANMRPIRQQFHIDTLWIVRTHLRSSSRPEDEEKLVGLDGEAIPVSWDAWLRDMSFDRDALDVIAARCRQEVSLLEQTYRRLIPYMRTLTRRSEVVRRHSGDQATAGRACRP